jgi:hypothetical protein
MNFVFYLLILLCPFMVFAEEVKKPLAVIFLDIDGVLMGARDLDPLSTWIRQKLVELFGAKDPKYRDYTELQWRIASSYFLNEPAVANLEKLIQRVSKVSDVAIVLSSAWRLDGNADEIRNQMFKTTSFAPLIIDKTPDEDWWRRRKGEEELSPVALRKYGFSLGSRGAEINYWLLENQEKWDVKNFVILDDVAYGILGRYPDNFVEVYRLLSEEDIEKAYQILTRH